jgi:hypothetical protein
MGVITGDDQLNQLARERAADKSGYIETCRTAFKTPSGDGCYCTHHPDDPAHGKDCYDLFKALSKGSFEVNQEGISTQWTQTN